MAKSLQSLVQERKNILKEMAKYENSTNEYKRLNDRQQKIKDEISKITAQIKSSK
jgi:DNA polymerase elongation subunit (family B)